MYSILFSCPWIPRCDVLLYIDSQIWDMVKNTVWVPGCGHEHEILTATNFRRTFLKLRQLLVSGMLRGQTLARHHSDATKVVHEDWLRDSPHPNFMEKDNFRMSMFQLVGACPL